MKHDQSDVMKVGWSIAANGSCTFSHTMKNVWFCPCVEALQSTVIRFLAGAGNFSLHHRVQNGSGAHPASYPMGTRGSFPGGKASGAWSWPLTPSSAEVKERVQLYLRSPNTPSWHGAQLKAQGLYLHLLQCTVKPVCNGIQRT
jgi:hypothetical protein